MTESEYIRIKREIYQELIEHLEIHAPTDAWAASLLEKLEADAKPSYLLTNGSYVLRDGEDEYQVN